MAKVSTDTIARLERGEALKERTVEHIQRVLEEAGVIFIAANGDDVGVRLKRTPFKHDASHLHALWKRERQNVRLPDGLAVNEVAEGLVCVAGNREVGRVEVVDGASRIWPDLPKPTSFPDRMTWHDLQAWVDAAASSAP